MDRQLLDYHPHWLREYKEIKLTSEIEQEQAEKLWNAVEKIWNNNFIETLDIDGIQRWEKMLDIVAQGTVDDRRNTILLRVAELRPFTMRSLKTMLDQVCGNDVAIITLNRNSYTLVVKVPHNVVESVSNLLNRIVPANIFLTVTDSNTYLNIHNYKHGELKPYTYGQIKTI